MSTFDELAHPRASAGTFTTTAHGEPAVELATAPPSYSVYGDWVVQDVDHCTCGGYGEGSGWSHEPGCGAEVVAPTSSLDLADSATATPEELAAAVARLDAMSGATWDRDLEHDVYFEYDRRRDDTGQVTAFRRRPVGHAEHGAWELVAEIPKTARLEFCLGSPDDDCLHGSCSHCWGRPNSDDLDWIAGRGYEDQVEEYKQSGSNFF